MKHSFYYRKHTFLSESLSTEQENYLILQFLDKFKIRLNANANSIEIKLLNVLQKLYDKNQFHIQFIDREANDNDLLSSAYGYFSAYENAIYLLVDRDNFEKKWLGLSVDYDNLNDQSFDKFISTCMHELMHYICTNYYNTFKKIWSNTIRQFIIFVFNYLVDNYFYDFVDKETFQNTSPKTFSSDIKFRKVVDVYYNSISINTRFRYKSSIKKYNDILSNLYSKHDFKYARFIDNILINLMRLREGSYGKSSSELYNAIKQGYYYLEPNLSKIKINILFYQELLDFSEIPSVLATYYKNIKNNLNLLERTLNII